LPKMLEAHRGYGGIGTLLVIKVCDCIWLVWFLFFWRVNQICFCVLVFRSLLNQPANLENWLQIQLLMSCFITPRNPKLLWMYIYYWDDPIFIASSSFDSYVLFWKHRSVIELTVVFMYLHLKFLMP